MDVWHQVKLHYIGLLVNHHQPELAETFFNSVTTKILHRTHFHNDFIFVRPGRQHRIHRKRRARRAAHLPGLLPHARNLHETLCHIVEAFSSSGSLWTCRAMPVAW
jgi:isocitrate dehydrogenase kinase/phosphatase